MSGTGKPMAYLKLSKNDGGASICHSPSESGTLLAGPVFGPTFRDRVIIVGVWFLMVVYDDEQE
jgi:hypothetical protein